MLDELQKAVTWLNQRGYAHGDIAPDNIVIDVKAGKLVLIDFGCAKDNPGDDDRDPKDFRNGLRRYVDFRVEADGERYRKAYAEAHSTDGP